MVHFRRFDPEEFHRRSIRLPEVDYSSKGYYFATVCTRDPEFQLSTIKNNRIVLTESGDFVKEYWEKVPMKFPDVKLDSYVIMPNHIHGIIHIIDHAGAIHSHDNVGAIHELPLQSPVQYRMNRRKMLIPKIIGWFKMNSAKSINILQETQGKPFWQRNYYETILFSDIELNRVRWYIRSNPKRWINQHFNSSQ